MEHRIISLKSGKLALTYEGAGPANAALWAELLLLEDQNVLTRKTLRSGTVVSAFDPAERARIESLVAQPVNGPHCQIKSRPAAPYVNRIAEQLQAREATAVDYDRNGWRGDHDGG